VSGGEFREKPGVRWLRLIGDLVDEGHPFLRVIAQERVAFFLLQGASTFCAFNGSQVAP